MAVYLCHERPDLFAHEATVVDSRPGAVVLSRSAFHPGGGGQVSDLGALEYTAGRADVTGIEFEGDGLDEPEGIRRTKVLLERVRDEITRNPAGVLP